MTLMRPRFWVVALVLPLLGTCLLAACGDDGPDRLQIERPLRVFRDPPGDCVILANNAAGACSDNDVHLLYGYYGESGSETVAAMTDVVLEDAAVPNHEFNHISLVNSDVPTYTLGIGLTTHGALARSAICVFLDLDNSPRTGYRDAAVSGIENLICEGARGYQIFWYDPGGNPIFQSESPDYAHFVTTDNGVVLILEGTDAVMLNTSVKVFVAIIDEGGTLQDSAGPLELAFPGGS